MKKSIIAAGATAAVLAAMPIVGVFATESDSFTDTLTVSIQDGCTFEKTGGTTGDYSQNDRTFTATNVTPGNIIYLNATDATTGPTGSHVTVTCNTGGDANKYLVVGLDVEGFSGTTAGNTIAGNDYVSGATSGWAIKSNASINTGSFTSDDWANYAAAADSNLFLKATTDKTVTFNPSYRVDVAPQQAADTYTATATYTVTVANS